MITQKEFRWLMEGLSIDQKQPSNLQRKEKCAEFSTEKMNIFVDIYSMPETSDLYRLFGLFMVKYIQ